MVTPICALPYSPKLKPIGTVPERMWNIDSHRCTFSQSNAMLSYGIIGVAYFKRWTNARKTSGKSRFYVRIGEAVFRESYQDDLSLAAHLPLNSHSVASIVNAKKNIRREAPITGSRPEAGALRPLNPTLGRYDLKKIDFYHLGAAALSAPGSAIA